MKASLTKLGDSHQNDFSGLSCKLDRILSQFWEEGSELREELFLLRQSHARQMGATSGAPKGDRPDEHRDESSRSKPTLDLRQQLWSTVAKGEWPKFSGQGKYDHLEFIQWINTVSADSSMPDKIIQMKLLTILTGVAGVWYRTMRTTVTDQQWLFWKEELIKKFGTSNWKRKKQEAFEKDKLMPGDTLPALWVTSQYKHLQVFDPHLSNKSINFRLLGLMDREVEYAAKTAMGATGAEMSTIINVLEDIVDKTRLGWKRTPYRLPPETPSTPWTEDKEKPKKGTSELKCFTCNKYV
ncbi:hypothetical protein PCASD_08106 [Puccinia coronata f. sp. avenae]|uniref:Uncharacterized protein n=1 Tax=Puccinia coronata f. sp. avenae TaxID=200324 RepID=A0A2N5VA88_9BASI|nr:hypothetical protein PCASD_08106 [Puccinia coronata f. sp. avenae]